MPDVSFTNLLVVAAVAVLAPLTVGFAPRLRVPAVVLEIIGGIIIRPSRFGLVDRDSSSHPNFRTKLDAIGYGFLVPVFFVASGIRLNLTGLLHSPSALARVPMFLAAFTSAWQAKPQAVHTKRAWLSRDFASTCPHAEHRWLVNAGLIFST